MIRASNAVRVATLTLALAAGGRVAVHGDGAAGEEEMDHPQSTLPPFTLSTSPVR